MLALLISWGVLALVIVILAMYRKMAARDETDIIHFDDPAFANRQQGIARRLDRIDAWGKPLTVLLAVYGLALAAWYLYRGWQSSQGLN